MPRATANLFSDNGVETTIREGEIRVPQVGLLQLDVEIVGLTSLLTNCMADAEKTKMRRKQTGQAEEPQKPRDPDRVYRDAMWIISGDRYGDLKQCRFGFNSLGVKEAMADAGMRHGGEKKALLLDLLSPTAELFEIIADVPTMREDIVRPQLNTTTIAWRPEYWPWKMNVAFVFPESLTAERVLNVLQLAGQTIGIGSWRPARKGIHGKFVIDHAELHRL